MRPDTLLPMSKLVTGKMTREAWGKLRAIRDEHRLRSLSDAVWWLIVHQKEEQ